MTKVYPNAVVSQTEQPLPVVGVSQTPLVLTVWKKSLLFSCNGFTVFDSNGNLVFRVDNYTAGTKAEIVLMDASGHSLLTIRRKVLFFFSIDFFRFNTHNTTSIYICLPRDPVPIPQ